MLTVKGPASGITRLEFEYEIPLDEANRMLDELCERPLVDKTRYRVDVGGLTWQIDEFHGDNDGLVLAEIELTSPDQAFVRPTWIGRGGACLVVSAISFAALSKLSSRRQY